MGKKLNNIMFFLAGVLSVIIIGILIIGITTWARERNNLPDEQPVVQDTSSSETWTSKKDNQNDSGQMADEKWQEGTISHNGKKYKYNNKLKVYLLMGIDRSGKVEASEDFTKGGQSDAMFLMVADEENQKMSIISINRNTMTDINICSVSGRSMGSIKGQICVQHGFGDGKKLSCERTVDAVKTLFYNIPISGYISINMDAIPQINGVVGGVTIEPIEDIGGVKKGETVTLTNEQAYQYLRGRDQGQFESATNRLRRQEQFINAFIKQVKETQGITQTKVESLYAKVVDYTVTSVDFVRLVTALLDYEYDESSLYTVPGETIMGNELEEYIVDEDSFYDLVINVFYREVGGN